jgi:hypothetical protein
MTETTLVTLASCLKKSRILRTAPSCLVKRLCQARGEIPASQSLQFLVCTHLGDRAILHDEDNVRMSNRASAYDVSEP